MVLIVAESHKYNFSEIVIQKNIDFYKLLDFVAYNRGLHEVTLGLSLLSL